MTAEMFEQPLGKEEQARQWLAEFASVLDVDDGASEAALQKSLDVAQRLAATGPDLRQSMPYLTVDPALVDTLDRAVKQIPSVADDLKKRLARATGAPLASDLNLDELRERLAEREARTELGVPTEEEMPARLELPATDPNYAAGAFTLIFGLGWTSFTTFHAVMMIGGLFHVIGFGALALLLFYAIFFAVGFGMLYAAYTSFGREQVTFEGLELKVTRTTFGRTSTKAFMLEPGSKAVIGSPSNPVMSNNSNQNNNGVVCISIRDASGKRRTFMSTQDRESLVEHVNRINAYLVAQKPISL